MKNRILIAVLSAAMVFGMSACGSVEDKNETVKQENTKTDEPEARQDDAKDNVKDDAQGDKKDSQKVENDAPSAGNDNPAETGNSGNEGIIEDGDGQETKNPSAITVNNSDDAEKLLESVLGTEDSETGYTYSFGYVDKVEVEGEAYYGFVWSWLVDDHLSKLSELLVKADGSAVYAAVCDGDTWEISGANMMK